MGMRTKSNSTGLTNATGEVLQVTLLWGDQPIEVRQFEPKDAVWAGGSPADDVVLDTEPFALARWHHDNWWACEPVIAAKPPQVGVARLTAGERVRIPVGRRHAAELVVVRRAERARGRGALDFRFLKTATVAAMVGATLLLGFAITDLAAAPVSEPVTAGWPGGISFRVPDRVKAPKTRERLIKVPPTASHPDTQPSKRGSATVRTVGDKRDHDRRTVKGVALIAALDDSGVALDQVLRGPVGGSGALDVGIGSKGQAVALDDSGGMTSSRSIVPGVGLGSLGGFGIKTLPAGRAGKLLELPTGTDEKPHVTLQLGSTKVMGGCERDLIARAMARYSQQIKMCYETALSQDPTLAGKLGVTFTIDPSGGVIAPAIAEASFNPKLMERCVLERIAHWVFPEPKGGGTCVINYPWVFRAAGSTDD